MFSLSEMDIHVLRLKVSGEVCLVMETWLKKWFNFHSDSTRSKTSMVATFTTKLIE